MKKTLFSICIFIFFLTAANGQSGLITEFEQKWTNAKAFTMELARSMPAEDYSYKPTEDQMNFTELMLHMVGNMNWLCSSYLGGEKIEYDLRKKDYNKEETLQILEKGFDLSLNAVKGLTPELLEEKVDFFAGEMSKRQILTLMNDHVTHHRGEAIIYARLNGVKPPKYRGW
ncbi:MAG: DinB family protein [Bacteroidota bacterium]